MNQPKKSNIFSRLYHGRDRTDVDPGDAARTVGSSGVSGVESNENLVKASGMGGSIGGNRMGHGAMMDAMGIDNQIMMTSEVVVKVSTRR